MGAVAKKEPQEERVRRVRQRGHPTTMIGFRCPDELLEVAEREDKRTDGIIALLDLAVDVRRELGDDWAEILVRAYKDQSTEGEALARIVKDALRHGTKAKR